MSLETNKTKKKKKTVCDCYAIFYLLYGSESSQMKILEATCDSTNE